MKKNYLIIILLSTIISCNKDLDRTNIFSGYLNHTFSLQIPDQKHIYICLPNMVCKGCVQASQKYLLHYIEKNPDVCCNITFIYSNNEAVNTELIRKLTSYFDQDCHIDGLPLSMGIDNLTFIITNKKKVRNVTAVIGQNFEIIDKILQN